MRWQNKSFNRRGAEKRKNPARGTGFVGRDDQIAYEFLQFCNLANTSDTKIPITKADIRLCIGPTLAILSFLFMPKLYQKKAPEYKRASPRFSIMKNTVPTHGQADVKRKEGKKIRPGA